MTKAMSSLLAFTSEHVNIGGGTGPRSQHFEDLGYTLTNGFPEMLYQLKVLPTMEKMGTPVPISSPAQRISTLKGFLTLWIGRQACGNEAQCVD